MSGLWTWEPQIWTLGHPSCKPLLGTRMRICLSIHLASEDIKDEGKDHNIGFANLHSKYISFKYKPKFEFIQFMVNFEGLLGLSHGRSLNDFTNTLILSKVNLSLISGLENCGHILQF